MKNVFFIAAMLLLGFGSLSAQSDWEVKVDWDFASSSTCDEYMSPYGYAIQLFVYDVNNNNYLVCDGEIHTESSSASYTTYTSAEVGAETYSANLADGYTPSFTVVAHVYMYDLSTQTRFCYATKSLSGVTMLEFSTNGVLLTPTFN